MRVLCWSLFWYALLYDLSIFASIFDVSERAGCFDFIVFWMSCYSKCPVALSPCAVGWSAVCDCGIS